MCIYSPEVARARANEKVATQMKKQEDGVITNPPFRTPKKNKQKSKRRDREGTPIPAMPIP